MNHQSEPVEISAEQLNISKGPWSLLDCRSEGLERLTIINADGKVVCRIENSVSGKPLSDEDVNNAHAISRLPQLLAEFKKTRINPNTSQNIMDIHQTPIPTPQDQSDQVTLIHYDRPIAWLASRAPGQGSLPQYEFISQVDELSPEEFQCQHWLEIYLACSVSEELANRIKDPETKVSFRDIYEAPDAQFWLEYMCYVPHTVEGAAGPYRLRMGQLENIPQDYLPANLDLPIRLD